MNAKAKKSAKNTTLTLSNEDAQQLLYMMTATIAGTKEMGDAAFNIYKALSNAGHFPYMKKYKFIDLSETFYQENSVSVE